MSTKLEHDEAIRPRGLMMATNQAYGGGLAERMRVENVVAITTRLRRDAIVAITEVRRDNPSPAIVCSSKQEDAYVVNLLLRGITAHQYWEDGRLSLVRDLRAGETHLYDMRRDRTCLLDQPYHFLLFYLSREALNAIADDVSAPHIGDLNHEPGSGIEDATIFRLGSSVLPALSRPDQANRLFVDHVTLAVGIHVAQTYGGMRSVSRIAHGRLAPWQERRAKEIIDANLGAARGYSAGVPPVNESFQPRVPSHCWNAAVQMAIVASHRACQGEAARWPIVNIGCGLGARLLRSEPSHASLHPIGRHNSGRMASGARRIASGDSCRFRRLCQDNQRTALLPLPA
jgi:AraC family transcriptional regulator